MYVDDIIIFTNDEEFKNQLKEYFMNIFKMKDLGAVNFILALAWT